MAFKKDLVIYAIDWHGDNENQKQLWLFQLCIHPWCKRCPSQTYSISFWTLQLKAVFFSCCSLSNMLFITKAFPPIAHKLRTYCAFKNRNCYQKVHFFQLLSQDFFPSSKANIELLAVFSQTQQNGKNIISLYITV